ncbi:MAG: hypothetical protein HY645_02835 [Acidobacteria bacterium]|nr:hypothetical protein [Acidobacteriota bacterium]
MLTKEFGPGSVNELTVTTTPEMGVTHLGPGSPALLSTPWMISWMEKAAQRLLATHLDPEYGSVGYRVDVRHLAATSIGATIRVRAVVSQVTGKRVVFSVEAFNEREKIGEGWHERVIIEKKRFSKATSIEERLRSLKIDLPQAGSAIGNYLPAVLHRGLLYVSGQLPRREGRTEFSGTVGVNLTVEQGYEAARLCALNALSVARQHLSDLSLICGVLRVAGFVRSAPDFGDQPAVVNGASDLFVQLLGEAGKHSRIAVGVAELPAGAAVELEVVFKVD